MTTIFQALTTTARRMGDRPAVVFADAGTGERTELGYATLHNWVSKCGNLLADELDIGLGAEVRLDVPLHWLAPVVALSAWATGAAVRVAPGGDAVVGHEGDRAPDGSIDGDLVIGTGMAGRPTADVGDVHTVTDVLRQPDEFVDDPGDEGAWAVGGRTQVTLLGEALGLGEGSRIVHAADRVTEDLLLLIARTLPAGVGLVLARGFEGDALRHLAEQEGAEQDGAERDGAERDGAEQDGAEAP